MTKKEIIELYLADLNNLVPDSDAKRSRIIDLEDELEALSQHDVIKSVCVWERKPMCEHHANYGKECFKCEHFEQNV